MFVIDCESKKSIFHARTILKKNGKIQNIILFKLFYLPLKRNEPIRLSRYSTLIF